MRLTGGQILARYLVRQGVPYAVGIPGHGCWAIVDAFADFSDRLTTLQVMHEQSAAHLADGYYRASGRALLQEIERTQWANFPRMMEPIVKRYWQVSRVDQLPYVLHRAFNQMLGGRPGPGLIDPPTGAPAAAAAGRH